MSAALHAPAVTLRRPSLPPWVGKVGWAVVSIGMFCAIWEMLWAAGLADPRLLPPPHVFLGNIAGQAKFFNTISRWQVGAGMVGEGGVGLLGAGGQRDPGLDAVQAVALGARLLEALAVRDAAPRRHPVHLVRADRLLRADAVAVHDLAVEQVGRGG